MKIKTASPDKFNAYMYDENDGETILIGSASTVSEAMRLLYGENENDEMILIGSASTVSEAMRLLPRDRDGQPRGQIQDGIDGDVVYCP